MEGVLDRSNVMYAFNCGEDGCSASYFGYTSNRLSKRIKQHRYSDSSIYKHFTVDHDKLPPTYDAFKEMFEIKYFSNEKIKVKIAEAISIKSDRPLINVKYNELFDFLKLF